MELYFSAYSLSVQPIHNLLLQKDYWQNAAVQQFHLHYKVIQKMGTCALKVALEQAAACYKLRMKCVDRTALLEWVSTVVLVLSFCCVLHIRAYPICRLHSRVSVLCLTPHGVFFSPSRGKKTTNVWHVSWGTKWIWGEYEQRREKGRRFTKITQSTWQQLIIILLQMQSKLPNKVKSESCPRTQSSCYRNSSFTNSFSSP